MIIEHNKVDWKNKIYSTDSNQDDPPQKKIIIREMDSKASLWQLRNSEKLTSARMLRETKFKMVVNEFQSNVVHNGFKLK